MARIPVIAWQSSAGDKLDVYIETDGCGWAGIRTSINGATQPIAAMQNLPAPHAHSSGKTIVAHIGKIGLTAEQRDTIRAAFSAAVAVPPGSSVFDSPATLHKTPAWLIDPRYGFAEPDTDQHTTDADNTPYQKGALER